MVKTYIGHGKLHYKIFIAAEYPVQNHPWAEKKNKHDLRIQPPQASEAIMVAKHNTESIIKTAVHLD